MLDNMELSSRNKGTNLSNKQITSLLHSTTQYISDEFINQMQQLWYAV